MIDSCLIKCSVSLARIKIRLDFQSTEAFRQKLTKKRKGDALSHKSSSGDRSWHDVWPWPNVYKLFALKWLGISVPRDNLFANWRCRPNATRTNTCSFVAATKMNRTSILLHIRKHFWRFKFIKIIFIHKDLYVWNS